jgi:hypothetical protein
MVQVALRGLKIRRWREKKHNIDIKEQRIGRKSVRI